MSKVNNIVVGKHGEDLATEYLKNNEFYILDRNFKCKIGEIDIVAKKDDVIIFVEVKTRSGDRFGMPREAVNYYKQRKIRNVASVYIKFKRLFDYSCRFDIIEILDGQITHIENAF